MRIIVSWNVFEALRIAGLLVAKPKPDEDGDPAAYGDWEATNGFGELWDSPTHIRQLYDCTLIAGATINFES